MKILIAAIALTAGAFTLANLRPIPDDGYGQAAGFHGTETVNVQNLKQWDEAGRKHVDDQPGGRQDNSS